MARRSTSRPTGVTVLSILNILSGAGFLLMGILMMFLFNFTIDPNTWPSTLAGLAGILVGIIAFLGIGLIIIGAVVIIIAVGLLKGKSWARTIYLISLFLGVMAGVISFGSAVNLGGPVDYAALGSGLGAVIIDTIIIVYFFKAKVKAFFRVT